MVTITHTGINAKFEVDENVSLSDIERNSYQFFKNKHGKRETFEVYRGCLITRYTVTFSNNESQRLTSVHVFAKYEGLEKPSLFCISTGNRCNSIKQAKQLVDKMFATEKYWHGFYLTSEKSVV